LNTVRFSGQLDSKGRITIPARIRKKLGLEKGSQVSLLLEPDRVVREEVSGYREALETVEKFQDVESFSFNGGVVEVVINER